MEPPLAAVGSATVAVLSQSSGVAAIFVHEAGSFFLSFLPPMEGEYHLEWSVGDLICSVLF